MTAGIETEFRKLDYLNITGVAAEFIYLSIPKYNAELLPAFGVD
jgi:hypothetical protein